MNQPLRKSGRRIPPKRRRGMALYLAVLTTTLIVSLLSMAGISVVRIQRRQAGDGNDIITARMNARSAVELALRVIANDSNWRNTYVSGQETTPMSLGPGARGTVSWILEDSDGSLADGDTDLRLKGVGRVGNTVQVSELELLSDRRTCLEVAMHAGEVLTVDGSDLLNDQTISSNNLVEETGGSAVYGSVEAVNDIVGDDFLGPTTIGVTPRTMPDSNVFNYYLANGTNIPITSLSGLTIKELKETLLSPSYNPYGPTNPQGIYVINCLGLKIRIKDCRIVGTVVLINPRSDSEIGADHIHWEPAVPNFPSLLVSGSIMLRMEYKLDGLDESKSGNLNPPGTPFPYVGGVVDGDSDDKWPSDFQGLIYATGDISIEHKDPRITGVVISGQELIVARDTQISYSSVFLNNPPPGFGTPGVQVIPGTWRRGAAP